MTVNEFIEKLQKIKAELRDKEIKVEAPNGLLFSPEITYQRVSKYEFGFDKDNVISVVITV